MKRWLAPIAVIAALAAGTGPALAASAKPTPVPTDTFNIQCPGTEVLEAQLSGKAGTIVLPGDRFIFTGPNLRITLTGPTDKTVSYVITGAVRATVQSDDSLYVTATGLNTIIVPEANGHPAGLFLTSGTFSWTLNPDGTERTLFSGTGKVTDVCALLAP
jgi:hypothetical protein